MFHYVCWYFSVSRFAGMLIKYLNINFELVQCILPSCISYLYTVPLKYNVALASKIRLGDCRLRSVALIFFASIYPVYCRIKTCKQSRCLALLISDQPITNKSTHRNSDRDSAIG